MPAESHQTGARLMNKQETPYKTHLFVCVKSRNGERKSCGDSGGGALRAALKEEIKNRGWKGAVRVSESSCLGVCDAGPNIMVHPQKIWFSGVTTADLPEILDQIADLIAE
jgi:(2Fe-2S) ferredoxin